ncbi:MAG: hypothetical protein ABR581_03780 [Thermoleophilaceae bacterium]
MRWNGLLASVVLGGALMWPAAAGAAGGDFAVGGGTNGFFQIGVSAHSGPNGEDPSGFVSARSRPNGGFPVPFRFGGHVTCLVVSGNHASIKYRFDHSDDPTLEGGGIQIFIEDNGPPQNGQSADGTSFLAPMTKEAFEASQPGVCAPPPPAGYTQGESGNFVVHDEP